MEEEEDFRLRFISSGLMHTPELSVLEAQKEIHNFARRIQRMFRLSRELLEEKDDTKFVKLFSRIEKYEAISDNMEVEIAAYLDQVSDRHLSDETKAKIRAMMREISEIESIGDSCYNIARTINRHHNSKDKFSEQQRDQIHQMFALTDQALTQMGVMLVGYRENTNINHSFQ